MSEITKAMVELAKALDELVNDTEKATAELFFQLGVVSQQIKNVTDTAKKIKEEIEKGKKEDES